MPPTVSNNRGILKPIKKSPSDQLRQLVSDLLLKSGRFSDDVIANLIQELPHKWERHGDLIVIPQRSLRDANWKIFEKEVFQIICETLKISRIARKNPVKPDSYRSSNIELLWGNNGIVHHVDNKIRYQWDITKCMFSIGNITEKLRIARFDCSNEVVVDLFAGIGYFTLPYLIHAKARYVHACEMNPDSVEALKLNLKSNGVDDRCTVHFGDNRTTAPSNVADRVNLGLIPSSELSWETACLALKNDFGGVLHIHANIDSKTPKTEQKHRTNLPQFKYAEWELWTNYAASTIEQILLRLKSCKWKVAVLHLEHVKSYAPHVDHVVLDVECRPNVG